MTPSSPPPDGYSLSLTPRSRDQIHLLSELARKRRRAREFAAFLQTMVENLEANPEGWGDPYHNLPDLDLVVYRKYLNRLSVTYGVHQHQRIVFLRSVEALPGHPLADE